MIGKKILAAIFVCLVPALAWAQFEADIADAQTFANGAAPSSTASSLSPSFNARQTTIGKTDPILGGAVAPTSSATSTPAAAGANNINACHANPSGPGCNAVNMLANYAPSNTVVIPPNDPMLVAAAANISGMPPGGPFSPGVTCTPVQPQTAIGAAIAYTTKTCDRPATVNSVTCNALLQPVVTATQIPEVVTGYTIRICDYYGGCSSYVNPTAFNPNTCLSLPRLPCGGGSYQGTVMPDGSGTWTTTTCVQGDPVFDGYGNQVFDMNGDPVYQESCTTTPNSYGGNANPGNGPACAFFCLNSFMGTVNSGGPVYGCANGAAPVNGECTSYTASATWNDGCSALRNSADAGMPQGTAAIPLPQ